VFFFPVFSAGPIENFKSLNPSVLENKFDANDFLYGLYRVLLGVFKIGFIANVILNPILKSYDPAHIGPLDSWISTLIGFMFLYINFSGFSDIAIGFSRLFGIKVRENFNSPLRSTNIQEFWQRWHMSLGAWVTQYLYFPLVRARGKPLLSLLFVFVFMGAWHSLDLNYLIWGVAHGTAMVFMSYVPKRMALKYDYYARIRQTRLFSILGCLLTISYVAVLSRFANHSSLDDGFNYLGSLI
jgi:alginate O-acetyltransferase complex protein AlgI